MTYKKSEGEGRGGGREGRQRKCKRGEDRRKGGYHQGGAETRRKRESHFPDFREKEDLIEKGKGKGKGMELRN